MADRFPLIVDSSTNQLKEIPSGDNLNLAGCNIINVIDVNLASDMILKDNIEYIENGSEIIKKINPVSFNWKHNNKKSYGVIAQDLEKILPELVREDEDSKIKSVSYVQLIPFLVQAIKELQNQIDILKNK